MNKEKQILLIEKFFNSDEETILINQVNEELGVFYLGIIKYYADKQDIKLSIDDNSEAIIVDNDLFGQKEVKIFNVSNSKKLASILNSHNKKIIFTDYKNYKKLNSKYNCINGYNFAFDIIFFIKNELKINNDELLEYCKNNPILLFSEVSKYLINSNQYSSDRALMEEKNHILNIRKSIFDIKKNNIDIINLYSKIKKEAEYKKLSFLIY